MLKSLGDEARVIAGGQSLVPLISLGLANPNYLVSLDSCQDLSDVNEGKESLKIGAMVTVTEVIRSELIKESVPILFHSAKKVATPHVRNFGTIVGNVCHADPSSDLIPSLLCCDARVCLVSGDKNREVLLEDFVDGPFTSVIQADEIAAFISIPRPNVEELVAYKKIARRAGDLGIATCAVVMRRENNFLKEVKISAGGYVQKAIRIHALEKLLTGIPLDEVKKQIDKLQTIEAITEKLLPVGGLSEADLSITFSRLIRSTLESALNGN